MPKNIEIGTEIVWNGFGEVNCLIVPSIRFCQLENVRKRIVPWGFWNDVKWFKVYKLGSQKLTLIMRLFLARVYCFYKILVLSCLKLLALFQLLINLLNLNQWFKQSTTVMSFWSRFIASTGIFLHTDNLYSARHTDSVGRSVDGTGRSYDCISSCLICNAISSSAGYLVFFTSAHSCALERVKNSVVLAEIYLLGDEAALRGREQEGQLSWERQSSLVA